MKNTFKKITPATGTEILGLDEKTLSIMAAITGQEISIGYAPLVGKYGRVNGKDIADVEPKHADLEFAYERDMNGKIIRIYVGSSIHGPLLSWCEDGWRNLYGHGNHGKNGACGGRWSSSSRKIWATMVDALDNRNYMVGGIEMHRNRLVEGPALLDALRDIAKTE